MEAKLRELKELRRWHSENTSLGGYYLPGALRRGPEVRRRIHELYWELVDAGIDPDGA